MHHMIEQVLIISINAGLIETISTGGRITPIVSIFTWCGVWTEVGSTFIE